MPGTATLERPKLEFKTFHAIQTKAVPDEPGVVEALVAVSGNTDDSGDVILTGAFNFKRNPKIVWSHDLKLLIAKVLAYEEWKPGDPRLPADLKAKGFGALWFKIAFDLEDPESFSKYRKVVFHEDLGWSIGYETDPKGFKVLPDGRRALSKIYVWEASPTTFGMNQEARTVSAKSLIHSTVESLGLSEEKAKAIQDLVATLVAPDEEKSYPALEGSFEETQDALRGAAQAYGVQVYGERSEENDWYCSIEGTFDDRVVVTFRFYGSEQENVTLQFPYTQDDMGAIELGEPAEVEVTATVAPATGTPAPTETAASTAADDTAAMAKALADLGDLEIKKGAVLSEANATTLRNALEAISKVLAAAEKGDPADDGKKPKATVKPKGDGKPPAKETPKEADPDLEGKDVLSAGDLLEMAALASS